MGRHLGRFLTDAIGKADGERDAVIERLVEKAEVGPDLVESILAGSVVPNEEQIGNLVESLDLDRDALNEAMERDEDWTGPMSEEDLAEFGPVIEAAHPIIKPRKGADVFDKDGCVEASIIRPCISRGRRIRGLPPIYEAAMLARHATVFNNWPMFMDHISESIREELVEKLRKRGRRVSELGGRVVEGWWNPDITFEDDEEYGFKKGAVVAKVLPQPAAKAIIEADPDALHLSINAWPTGVKPGVSAGVRGALIEGIRRKPMGSVDFVPRGGAGGRVLNPTEKKAVEEHILELVEEWVEEVPDLSESHRRYPRGNRSRLSAEQVADLSTYSAEELAEHIRENHPDLIDSLSEEEGDEEKGGKKKAAAKSTSTKKDDEEPKGITEEDLAERETQLREDFDNRLAEEREAASFAQVAEGMIRESGLPRRHRADLLARYTMLPSGPADGLKLAEGEVEEDESREEAFKRLLQEDLDHVAELVREAAGDPAVRGQGRSSASVTEGEEGEEDEFAEQAVEMGLLEKEEEFDEVVEGMRD